jgi:hypothetical protein
MIIPSSISEYIPSRASVIQKGKDACIDTLELCKNTYRRGKPILSDAYDWVTHWGYSQDLDDPIDIELDTRIHSMYHEWLTKYVNQTGMVVYLNNVHDAFLFLLGFEDFDVFGLNLKYDPHVFFICARECSFYEEYKREIDYYCDQYNWYNV